MNMIRLEYQDWLWFYDIFDTEDNYALGFDMYSYGGEQLILPRDVNEDEYNAKLSLDAVNDSEDVYKRQISKLSRILIIW